MPKLVISITSTQEQALQQKVRLAGKGSIGSQIRKAIDQYLAGPKQIEAAFLTLMKSKAPKDLPPLSTIQKKLKKTTRSIDRTLARLKTSERRLAALDRIDTSAIGLLALEAFGSADKAYDWFQRSNQALAGKTPFSVLTTASGYTSVETVMRRMAHGVPRHGGTT